MIRQDQASRMEPWSPQLGGLGIPSSGTGVIQPLEWEPLAQKIDAVPQAHVSPGDVLVDCGGLAGTALSSGAGRFLAIEWQKSSIAAFRRSFSSELKSGKAKLVKTGFWEKPGRLPLPLSTVGLPPQDAGRDPMTSATTIDELVPGRGRRGLLRARRGDAGRNA